jgi:hypothetical protein
MMATAIRTTVVCMCRVINLADSTESAPDHRMGRLLPATYRRNADDLWSPAVRICWGTHGPNDGPKGDRCTGRRELAADAALVKVAYCRTAAVDRRLRRVGDTGNRAPCAPVRVPLTASDRCSRRM